LIRAGMRRYGVPLQLMPSTLQINKLATHGLCTTFNL
jgi:hypothetical protein